MAGITARYFDRDFLGLLLMHILEMSAEDSTLGEPLGTVWTFVWFFTIVLSEVNQHVAALGECLSTVVNKTFEESLLPVGLWVVNLDGLTHLFRDGFVPFRSLLFLLVPFGSRWLPFLLPFSLAGAVWFLFYGCVVRCLAP